MISCRRGDDADNPWTQATSECRTSEDWLLRVLERLPAFKNLTEPKFSSFHRMGRQWLKDCNTIWMDIREKLHPLVIEVLMHVELTLDGQPQRKLFRYLTKGKLGCGKNLIWPLTGVWCLSKGLRKTPETGDTFIYIAMIRPYTWYRLGTFYLTSEKHPFNEYLASVPQPASRDFVNTICWTEDVRTSQKSPEIPNRQKKCGLFCRFTVWVIELLS